MPKRSPKPGTEIVASDREARAVELRAKGWNFQAIAGELGFADASGASKAYHRALQRRPAQNVDQLREQEAERLEYMWRKTAEVIESPPYAFSSIAKTIPDPDYPVDPKDKHVSLAGKYIKDESVKLRAIESYRKLSESFRKLTGIDIGAAAEITPELRGELAEALAECRRASVRSRELELENGILRARLTGLQARLHDYENGSIVPAEVDYGR